MGRRANLASSQRLPFSQCHRCTPPCSCCQARATSNRSLTPRKRTKTFNLERMTNKRPQLSLKETYLTMYCQASLKRNLTIVSLSKSTTVHAKLAPQLHKPRLATDAKTREIFQRRLLPEAMINSYWVEVQATVTPRKSTKRAMQVMLLRRQHLLRRIMCLSS